MISLSSNILDKLRKHRNELLIIGILILVVGIAHGWNMFHFPYYEDDEGTYMAQAWSLVTQGKLAPYTYWYDHAPAGWMLIALWSKLTGGFFTWGFSINSGRVLMLILHLGSVVSLYTIARKLTKSKYAAILAALLFSLNPLTLALQRRVLLDNIMIFWLLLSIAVLLHSNQRLRRYALSGFFFAIAFLSKESAIFFLPVLLYLCYTSARHKSQRFVLTTWAASSFGVMLMYPIYALLKGELFPTGTLLGGNNPHVSLIGSLAYQAGRSAAGFFSSFMFVFKQWVTNYPLATFVKDDPLTIFGGALSTVITLIMGLKNRTALILGLLSLSYWLFLMRGGSDIDFYVLPLIPFISLTTAYVLWKASLNLKWKLIRPLPVIAYTALLCYMWSWHSGYQFNNAFRADQTTPQIQAVKWVLNQHTPARFYSMDMYAYIDLHAHNSGNFAHADYYWKVSEDPNISQKLLHNNFKNIDYILVTHQLAIDTKLSHLALNDQALSNAKEVTSFSNDGYSVAIYKVTK